MLQFGEHILSLSVSYMYYVCFKSFYLVLGSNDWTRSLLPPNQLPMADELSTFICNDPSVPIPIDQRLWATIMQLGNTSDEKEISKLFVVNGINPSTIVAEFMIYKALASPQAEKDVTKYAFVSTWDNVFQFPLLFFCPNGNADRNTSYNSCTESARPDFLFYIQGKCVCRGEEKQDEKEMYSAHEEITAKMEVWEYDILAYAAAGLKVDLLAIMNPNRNDGKIIVHCIATYHLTIFLDRLKLFRAVLNISILLPVIATHCAAPSNPEIYTIRRECGAFIHTFNTSVIKTYPAADGGKKVMHLKQIYSIMNESQVCNVDNLKYHNAKKCYVVLSPFGIVAPPTNLKHLLIALKDVLVALTGLHSAGLMHRDIRWPNVLQYRNKERWFLIDFDDAMIFPQDSCTAKHLNGQSHAPEMFIKGGNHSYQVDIWGVGYLIMTAKCVTTDGLHMLQSKCMLDNPDERPSVNDVLHSVQELIGYN